MTAFTPPFIEDFGSIASHTFSVCNPSGAIPNNGGQIPPKGPEDVPHHIDNFLECSGLSE